MSEQKYWAVTAPAVTAVFPADSEDEAKQLMYRALGFVGDMPHYWLLYVDLNAMQVEEAQFDPAMRDEVNQWVELAKSKERTQ